MTAVSCWNEECTHCQHGWCKRREIEIGEDRECENFQHYKENYKQSFWKALLKDGKTFRRLCKHGKKIEYKGYTFYTDEKITDSGYYFLTEARTGIGVCEYNQLEKRWDKFVAKVGNYPDVTDLPIEEDNP